MTRMQIKIYPRTLREMLSSLLIALVVSYASAMGFAMLLAPRMVFPAPESSYALDDNGILQLEGNQQTQCDIPALLIEASGGHQREKSPFSPAPVLLYAHGNGEDLGMIRHRVEDLAQRGFRVFAYEYPGYGPTKGSPSEAKTYAAADLAWKYLVEHKNIPADQIVLYGRSLGGGPSFYLASKHPDAGALITEATFSSTFRVKTHIKLFPFDIFDNLKRIGEVSIPILLIHGKKDSVIPFAHAKQLRKAGNEDVSHLWIEEAGHNDIVEVAPDVYYRDLNHFLKKHLDSQSQI